MKTNFKKAKQMFDDRFGADLIRVSDIDCFKTRQALRGIKFILRGGVETFSEDFDCFKDVKIFINEKVASK